MKTPNVVHLHLMRVIGIHGIGSAIVSLQAPGFLHECDKRVQFVARIIVSNKVLIVSIIQLVCGVRVCSSKTSYTLTSRD